jgi:hypothetical protein
MPRWPAGQAGHLPRHGLKHRVGLTCSFSTTTPASRTASQLVLMDTFQRYFDYEVVCICGIPEITLAGTPEDFRDSRRRVEVYGVRWGEC